MTLRFSMKYLDFRKQVQVALRKATYRNLGHAAASIRKAAVESIKPGEGPSPPGTPPHTQTQKVTKKGKVRKGQLPRAIVYTVDKEKQMALIGPRASVVGESAKAHEFGGQFKDETFPKRPFMGPALAAKKDGLASHWAGSLGS